MTVPSHVLLGTADFGAVSVHSLTACTLAAEHFSAKEADDGICEVFARGRTLPPR